MSEQDHSKLFDPFCYHLCLMVHRKLNEIEIGAKVFSNKFVCTKIVYHLLKVSKFHPLYLSFHEDDLNTSQSAQPILG